MTGKLLAFWKLHIQERCSLKREVVTTRDSSTYSQFFCVTNTCMVTVKKVFNCSNALYKMSLANSILFYRLKMCKLKYNVYQKACLHVKAGVSCTNKQLGNKIKPWIQLDPTKSNADSNYFEFPVISFRINFLLPWEFKIVAFNCTIRG